MPRAKEREAEEERRGEEERGRKEEPKGGRATGRGRERGRGGKSCKIVDASDTRVLLSSLGPLLIL